MGERARTSGEDRAPRLRLDELLDDLQAHVQRVRDTRDRVHTLLDAVVAISTGLEVEVVLRQIVESAVALVDAEYGALGVLGEEGRIRQFITVGMDQATIDGIGHYPDGRGILGLLIREPHPLRLPDLGAHPDSSGFPAGHPPMRTFLGAPVRVRDRIFGNLYLTDKRGGAEFDPDDESVLQTLAAAAGVAIDNARLYDESRHRERRLAASAELTRSLLSGADPAEILGSLAATVREMADADLVTLAVPVGDAGDLVIDTAAGEAADQVRGLALSGATLAAKVYATGQTITSPSLSTDERSVGGSASQVPLGPAFFVPLGTPQRVHGVLQVANAFDRPEFSDAVLEMIGTFADQAALALEMAEHRRDAEQRSMLGDRDRIARDLHDLVIQRLFAGGLTLQSALGRLAGRPDAAERIQRVVGDLDDTIKVIRSTIYGLQQRDRPGQSTSLRARLLAETDRAGQALGFTPALRMTGLLDTLVPPDHAEHLLAVLREALSNAARHAQATAVEVAAEVTEQTLRLRVTDNGRGIDPAATRRSGLANLRTRAEDLGGTCTFAPNQPTGTVVEWTAPLAGTGAGADGA